MKLIKTTLTVFLFLCVNLIFSQTVISGELQKWHTVTITFDGPNTSETSGTNPFLNYRLNVTFNSPNGKTFIVPGFYAADGRAAETSATSGNKWRVRFTPNETGRWTYTASFRRGTNVAISLNANAGTPTSFNGERGSFNIAASTKSKPDNRARGRLNYVGERYLKFEDDNTYFLKAGSDSPENLLAYNDFDNTIASKTWSPHGRDWRSGDPVWKGSKGKELIGAINYLSNKGMNAFSFLTMNVNGDAKDVWPWAASIHGKVNGSSAADLENRKRYDVSKLAQWEILFSHADAKGMYLHFKTQETENELLLDGGELGTQRKLYYRELVARFGHHLALNWNLGEEHRLYEKLNDTENTRAKAYASYIKSLDPYDNHIVIHSWPQTSHQDKLFGPFLGGGNQLTGISAQIEINNIHADVKKWVVASKNAGKKWVVANDEQGDALRGVTTDASYGGSNGSHSDNRKDVRNKVLWGTLMAGGAGVEYYFGYETGQTDLTAQDFRSRDTKWNDAKIALDFFNNHLLFWEMDTHDELTSSSADYCLAKLNDTYAIYLPNGGSTKLNLSNASGTYTVKWFNPSKGGSLLNGSISQISGGNNVSIGNPPSNTSSDWVALVKKAGTAIDVPVTRIYVTPQRASIKEGETVTLSYTISPSNATNQSATWSSEDETIATVDQNGVVRGLKEGAVQIEAKSSNGLTSNSLVTITPRENGDVPVSGVEVSPQSATIAEGESRTLSAVVSPSNATNKTITWSTSNSNIAVVNNGVVRGVNQGEVVITATTSDGGFISSAVITVTSTSEENVPVTRIYVTPQRVSLEEGATTVLSYSISPSNATNKTATWRSTNTSIATVDANGVVRGLKAGIAKIEAISSNGLKSDATLTVTPREDGDVPASGVEVSPQSATISEGESRTLSAVVSPSNATNKTVTWSTSNSNIAVVNNGVVRGVNQGEVVITATTSDGGFISSAVITVTSTSEENVPVTRIYVTPQRVSLEEGATTVLSYSISPSNATNKTAIWRSTNTSIATVDANGVVRGLKAGIAKIEAISSNGLKSDATLTVTPREDGDVPASGVEVSPQSATIAEGESRTLSAVVSPSNATNKTVTWSTSNSNIAVVNNGVVRGVNQGEVVITATTSDGGFISSAVITVTSTSEENVPVTRIYVTPQRVSLEEGATTVLSYSISPSNATNKTATWRSTNTSIATVDANGVVRGVKAGSAKIEAISSNGLKSDATLTVTPSENSSVAVTGIQISPQSSTIQVGGSLVLSAVISPSNASNKNVNWTSNNTNVAVVNNGVVSTLGEGQVVISAITSDGGFVSSAAITVTSETEENVPVTRIYVTPQRVSLNTGETTTLSYEISPSNATNKNATWFSKNERIATVDQNGVVTALSAGVVEIEAVSADGSFRSDATITVVGQFNARKQRIIVYPNPTSDMVRIAGLTGSKSWIGLYSFDGVLLQQQTIKTGQEAGMSLNGYSEGTYMIKIIDQNRTTIQNVVKR